MQWLSLFIEEMCCPAEVSLIQSELSRKPGVGDMEFDLFSQRLNVQHDPAIVTPNGVCRFLAEFGMTAHPWRDVREMTDFQGRSQRLRTLTTWMSGLFLTPQGNDLRIPFCKRTSFVETNCFHVGHHLDKPTTSN